MEILGISFFVVIVLLVSYVVRKKEQEDDKNPDEALEQMNKKEEEINNRIMETVDNFLKDALYFDHIGNLNKEKVYKYISNEGKIYEFFDFMVEKNQRIGIDEDNLCFRKMSYKRNDEAIIMVE